MAVEMNSDDDFCIIAITRPEIDIPGELSIISEILRDNRVRYVHLRKPGASANVLQTLIEGIAPAYRSRLTIHDHFELLSVYPYLGIHTNTRNPNAPAAARRWSHSCHSMNEAALHPDCDYVTLSPIYASISKPGYGPVTFADPKDLSTGYPPIIALGGVTPERFPHLRQRGFAGAAMTGYFFN